MRRAEEAAADLLHRPELARLLAALNGDGEETRIVGGAVRNSLLGRPVTEIDLATTAPPEAVAARARKAGFKAVPTGVEHGTVTVVVAGTPFEVTTLREDVETFGRRAKVRFGRDFGHDARRRDFTMNALFLDAHGRLRDPIGGLADLEAGRVRFIGDPASRIREDYLRILRFFRFHAEYGRGALDRAGFDAAIRARGGLAGLSRERVRAELLKLVAAPRAAEVVQELSDAGLLAMLIGGVGETGRLARAAAAEEQGEAPQPVRRLAALAVLTPEDADRLRDMLRLSNAEHARLAAYPRALVALRASGVALDEAAVRRAAVLHGVEALGDALAATAGEPRPVLSPEGLDAARRFAAGAPAPVFPLRGADLVERGMAPGEDVGRRLAHARDLWLAEGCPEGKRVRQKLLEAAAQA